MMLTALDLGSAGILPPGRWRYSQYWQPQT